jgi:hypothetical protein
MSARSAKDENMAFVEDAVEVLTEGGLDVGAIVGVGALLVWPLVRPMVREGTKMAIKGRIGLYQWAAETAAEAQGSMSDLVAEAQHGADHPERGTGARRHGSSSSVASTAKV